MIRLNVFFEISEDADTNQLRALCSELVEKSLGDAGVITYHFMQSVTNSREMMICETWQDDASLEAHQQQEHFVRLVPQIRAFAVNGMRRQRFDF